jgi:hypothetical protein
MPFRKIISRVLLVAALSLTAAQPISDIVEVSGIVVDFNNHPLDGATVLFKDELFKDLETATTNTRGEFRVKLPKRSYTVFAVKDYGKNYLEYWHWNYQPKANIPLRIRIDGIELYGMKAFTAGSTKLPSLIVYFRPMSLQRLKNLGSPSEDELPKSGHIDIAPEFTAKDVTATLNGAPIEILGLNSVKEYIKSDLSIQAFLIHLKLINGSLSLPRGTLCLTVHDPEISEYGMGCMDL